MSEFVYLGQVDPESEAFVAEIEAEFGDKIRRLGTHLREVFSAHASGYEILIRWKNDELTVTLGLKNETEENAHAKN